MSLRRNFFVFHLKILIGVFIAFNRAIDELLGLSNGVEATFGPFLASLILHLPFYTSTQQETHLTTIHTRLFRNTKPCGNRGSQEQTFNSNKRQFHEG